MAKTRIGKTLENFTRRQATRENRLARAAARRDPDHGFHGSKRVPATVRDRRVEQAAKIERKRNIRHNRTAATREAGDKQFADRDSKHFKLHAPSRLRAGS